MGEQRHSFSIASSFDQRLTLVISYLFFLSSFLFWPQSDSRIFLFVELGLFIALTAFFIRQWWCLIRWHCGFSLSTSGSGIFADGQQFVLVRRAFISAFVVIFYYQCVGESKKKMLVVWSDMLTDTDYRHLCRLLCQQ
ncbi:protein YgfX [uncultured Shewanella sp.]|uniref:protein YgfX n=1 Tax=uncultured Shewanella sp. TaxID=173975 RepID=UPI00262A4D30|nr:protein YgfX [uncultured Shewanella sp.]